MAGLEWDRSGRGALARLAARMRPGHLDKALIADADPARSLQLAARAAILTSPRFRKSLAAGLEQLLRSTHRRANGPRVLPRRNAVSANASELRELVDLLRGPSAALRARHSPRCPARDRRNGPGLSRRWRCAQAPAAQSPRRDGRERAARIHLRAGQARAAAICSKAQAMDERPQSGRRHQMHALNMILAQQRIADLLEAARRERPPRGSRRRTYRARRLRVQTAQRVVALWPARFVIGHHDFRACARSRWGSEHKERWGPGHRERGG